MVITNHAIVDLNDPSGLHSLSTALREWEPQFELYVPPRQSRLFDPDGTLYAVSLCDRMACSYQHRTRDVGRGDLIVVPQGLPVDVEPEVVLLGLCCMGPAPDHFRERFIQIWGFEHLPVPPFLAQSGAFQDVIAATDLRHRISYATCDLSEGDAVSQNTSFDFHLLFGLSGNPFLSLGNCDDFVPLPPGFLAAARPQSSYAARGNGRIGCLRLANELVYNAQRLAAIQSGEFSLSPEYAPPPPDASRARAPES